VDLWFIPNVGTRFPEKYFVKAEIDRWLTADSGGPGGSGVGGLWNISQWTYCIYGSPFIL